MYIHDTYVCIHVHVRADLDGLLVETTMRLRLCKLATHSMQLLSVRELFSCMRVDLTIDLTSSQIDACLVNAKDPATDRVDVRRFANAHNIRRLRAGNSEEILTITSVEANLYRHCLELI